jgi:hypothetical protein
MFALSICVSMSIEIRRGRGEENVLCCEGGGVVFLLQKELALGRIN